jgi:hypothetical protein
MRLSSIGVAAWTGATTTPGFEPQVSSRTRTRKGGGQEIVVVRTFERNVAKVTSSYPTKLSCSCYPFKFSLTTVVHGLLLPQYLKVPTILEYGTYVNSYAAIQYMYGIYQNLFFFIASIHLQPNALLWVIYIVYSNSIVLYPHWMHDQESLSLVLNNIPYLVIQNQFYSGTYNTDLSRLYCTSVHV